MGQAMIDRTVCHPFEGVHLLNGQCHCFDNAKIKQAGHRLRFHPEVFESVQKEYELLRARYPSKPEILLWDMAHKYVRVQLQADTAIIKCQIACDSL
jgi:hypothetical protein